MKLEYEQMVGSITYIKALDEGHFLVCFVLPLCVYFCCFYMWVPVVPLLENIGETPEDGSRFYIGAKPQGMVLVSK
jgi:hypothetical protein